MDQDHAPQKEKKTILVVDDDTSVLAVVSGFLVDGGYNVLTASSGTKGLQQSRDFKGEIHLLLSDFQLQGTSGADLAISMTLERPSLKVLLMGFPEGGMPALGEGWHFLDKPLVMSPLCALVVGLIFLDKKPEFPQ
jgi:DNA-binding NtrC family response regulator